VSVFLATVWASVDTSKRVGDRDHLKLFATEDAANEWFRDNDPERRRRTQAEQTA
jgi:hypothetical protein